MRILLTGADGFTGKYFAAEAKSAGHEIVHLIANLNDVDSLNAEVRTSYPDAVVHLAAITFVAHDDVDEIYQVNIVGTRNLLSALAGLQQAPKFVLLASSANVYGNGILEEMDELTIPSPTNDYAVSKLEMEYMAKIWMDRLPIIITRPFNYSGVGQSPQFLLPKIVDHFKRNERFIELGNIDIERDFSDVRFVVKAYLALLSNAAIGQTVNICSGRSCSLKEVLNTMAEIAGYEIEVRVNPLFVRSNDVKKLFGSNKKLRKIASELPDIDLKDTLSWMYHSEATKV